MKRGEVVLVDFPFASGGGNSVLRDIDRRSDHQQVSRSASVSTQFSIVSSSPDWKGSGLRMPSVVKCENIYTFGQSRIVATIGRLSAASMTAIDDCLKEALGIP